MKRWKDMNERQRNRRKKSMLRHAILALGAVGLTAVVALGALGAVRLIRSRRNAPLPTMEYISSGAAQNPLIFADEPGNETPPEASLPAGPAKDGEMVLQIGDEIHSETAILIDADENTVIAAKNCDATVYPASMTKVMTLLAAVEAIDDLDKETFIPIEIIDRLYRQGATTSGLRSDEATTPRTLLYGAILRSAGDAAEALGVVADGDVAAFVQRMNQKARELGLSEGTHFANTSGMYADDNTVTARDMAAIMLAAMQNETCAQVLSTVRFTAREATDGDEGILFYNKYLQWFIEKQPEHNTISACKSGYIWQARNCIVTYATGESGKHYICVTTGAPNASNMMNDQRLILGVYGG